MIIVKYRIEVNNIVSKYKNMSIDIGNHKVSCIKSIDEISSKVQLRNCKFQRMKLMTSRFWLSLITGRDFATEEHKINILFNILLKIHHLLFPIVALFKNIIQEKEYIFIINLLLEMNINTLKKKNLKNIIFSSTKFYPIRIQNRIINLSVRVFPNELNIAS